jgi:MFS family permease
MTVSTVGTWMQLVAQDWLVLDITGDSGSALGVATALQFLPLLIFGLWGGVVADRYPKRLVLMASQTAMGVLALVLGGLAVSGSVRTWQVYALALALGLVRLVDTPTRQSFVVELVGPADRANAIALQGAAMATARIGGPAAAGVVINLVGVGSAFLINGLSFSVVILVLRLMRVEELHAAPRVPRTKGQVRAGLAYVRGRGDLALVLALVGFVAAFGMNTQMTTALMAKDVFHAGAGSYGLASTAFAIGSLTGALLAARGGPPSRRFVIGAAMLFGVLETASGLLPTYASFLALQPPTGLALVMFTNGVVVTIQLDVAPEMRGRVNGLYYLLFTGTTPIGAPVTGWFAQEFGARAGLLADGAVTILATATVAPLLARQVRVRPRVEAITTDHPDGR